MICNAAMGCVFSAAEEETKAAVKNHGDFNSHHEAIAVLKEEIEELTEAAESLKSVELFNLHSLWTQIRADNLHSTDEISEIGEKAYQIAFEAVQVAAVCSKWIFLFEANKSSE